MHILLRFISPDSIDNKPKVVLLINRHNIEDGLIHALNTRAKWWPLSTPFGNIPATLYFNIGVGVNYVLLKRCLYTISINARRKSRKKLMTLWHANVSASLVLCKGIQQLIPHKGPKAFRFEVRLNELLTHWGRVTHICVSKLIIIGSDNGLSPGRRQAIIWTNDGILLIRTFRTHFSEIVSEIHTSSFKKLHFKMSSGKWRPYWLGLNVLTLEFSVWNLGAMALIWRHVIS